MSDKVTQEFYCGECNGFIWLSVNKHLNHEFWFCCPNCGHKHRRVMRDGEIIEKGRFGSEPVEELIVTKSAYSTEPQTKTMRDNYSRRDGAVVDNNNAKEELSPERYNRWFERFGGLQNE